MTTQTFQITGMNCAACSATVERTTRKLDGVSKAEVNLLANQMVAEFDESKVTPQQIIDAIVKEGYGASVKGEKPKAGEVDEGLKLAEKQTKSMLRRLIWSVVILVPLMYLSMGHMFGLPLPGFLSGLENGVSYGMAQLVLTLLIVFLNQSYFKRGIPALFRGHPNMDSLIAVGSLAAILYGIFAICRMGYGLAVQDWALVEQYHMDLYFESASTILTLITVGKYLETRSKGKTGQALAQLMALAPKTATVLKNGQPVTVSADQLRPGDLVLVKAGEQIPADGIITDGSAAVDQSAVTGESIPADLTVGDEVIGATVCQSGLLTFRVERAGEDSTLSQIIRLVEQAGGTKAPIARTADKVAAVFVPVVMGIALIAALCWLFTGHSPEFALTIGISVLVISCPCALGLATPVAIMAGTGRAANQGILFRDAESLEQTKHIQVVVMDKTGTLTLGKPAITQIRTAQGITRQQLLALAAAVESGSEHPLASAVLEAARKEGISWAAPEDYQTFPGRGASALVSGHSVLAGNRRLMEENGVDCAGWDAVWQEVALQGCTPLWFAVDGRLAGLLGAADQLRSNSAATVKALQKMGMEVVMLTGDVETTAQAIGRQAGVDRVIAGVLPQQKEEAVRQMQAQGKKVAMVGDGINDAPALMAADVGIAMGGGTHIAMESAGVVLMDSDPSRLVTAFELSRKTMRIIKENLFWAFFYNCIGIPVAAGVLFPFTGWLLSPMIAAAAMSLSSVCVVSNALRLMAFAPKHGIPRQVLPETKCNLPSGGACSLAEENTKTEESDMKKIVAVEGMHCEHCAASVEKAVSAVAGVSGAKVNLKKKNVTVSMDQPVDNALLAKAIEEAGFQPGEVTEKTGIFG